ncbi:hypothetical protein N9R04_07955 [Staphylococcus sp. SQ8-PEA]|uniref:Uncharacterized protein n=1 Tax=Staphylococcus marylandisciuri TaxID=2981529 RepID=A0ABT2QRR3_9STAP|nr:hypothetical protein [Staphylococcus marylandisciuri]MCU5746642.1 hypothetical protein [Staphylococcus marylandisciuri]
MIDGRYADYQNVAFKVVDETGNEYVLVTEDAEAESLGFEAQTTKHTTHTLYYKKVAKNEVDRIYVLSQEARYGGAVFDLFQDVEGSNYIGTDNQDKAEAFGLESNGEDYYSKKVDEDEIDKIIYRKDID